jgi:hypothetical protein
MPSEQFDRLIRDFCAAVQIDDVASVLETGSVSVNDVAFSIFPTDEEEGQADGALVYCDFGPIPSQNGPAVLRRLLEVNLFLTSAPLSCSFAINPESEHVILAFRSPLDTTTAEALATSLQLCAEEAAHWRQTHFLDGDPQPLKAAAPMRSGPMMV